MIPPVIADKAISDAAQLEQHSWDQEEADQGMTEQDAADDEAGREVRREQCQQDGRDGAGQTGIGFDARIGSGASPPSYYCTPAYLHQCRIAASATLE